MIKLIVEWLKIVNSNYIQEDIYEYRQKKHMFNEKSIWGKFS